MSNIEIAERAIRLMENVIKNELPVVSCPEKMHHVRWKREEVKQIIISKLQSPGANMIGPQQLKNE